MSQFKCARSCRAAGSFMSRGTPTRSLKYSAEATTAAPSKSPTSFTCTAQAARRRQQILPWSENDRVLVSHVVSASVPCGYFAGIIFCPITHWSSLEFYPVQRSLQHSCNKECKTGAVGALTLLCVHRQKHKLVRPPHLSQQQAIGTSIIMQPPTKRMSQHTP